MHSSRTLALILLIITVITSHAKDLTYQTAQGLVVIPESSQPKPNKDVMTTDLIITKPKNVRFSGIPNGETPASLACVYGLTTPISGCNINNATTVPTGGWGAIAVVEGYYNPYAMNDLNTFSTKFNLPLVTLNSTFFQKFANSATDVQNGAPVCGTTQPLQGWWDEQVLDIEMAHAMAPHAIIYVVSAQSDATADLMVAVECATSYVQSQNGGVVSMSWSKIEFAGENSYDTNFQNANVVYVSSAGDYSAGARYPSTSPYVVSAGGASIERDSNGNYLSESAWSTNSSAPPGGKTGGSGGPSIYEARPAFQNVVQRIVGAFRGTPDISAQANPSPGVVVYSSYAGGWITTGGTSAAAPILAGIINAANHRAANSQDELTYIYGYYPHGYLSYWNNISVGNNGFPAMRGYDFVTGLGTPRSYAGK